MSDTHQGGPASGAVGESMLVNAVDRRDHPVGVVRRGEIFAQHVNFRVVHVLLFNTSGDLLIQQLSLSRPRHAGYWGSSVAGYLFANESYESAAVRRLKQELQVTDLPLQLIGKDKMDDEGCWKFIGVFTAVKNGPFRFDPDHIENIEFLPMRDIKRLVESSSRSFTPTFLQVLKFYTDHHGMGQ